TAAVTHWSARPRDDLPDVAVRPILPVAFRIAHFCSQELQSRAGAPRIAWKSRGFRPQRWNQGCLLALGSSVRVTPGALTWQTRLSHLSHGDAMSIVRAAAVVVVVVLASAPAQAGVVINEILYHSPDDLDNLQFIELHNTGTTAVDISGWKLSK